MANNPNFANFELEGEIFWPSFYSLDNYDKWGCILGNLSEDMVTLAEEAHLKINESEDFGKFVRLQRKPTKKNRDTGAMEENTPVEVFDAATRRKWNSSKGIGNGTKAGVLGLSIRYDEKGNKWTNQLQKVRILDLVEYNSVGGGESWEMLPEEEGVADETPNTEAPTLSFDESTGDDISDIGKEPDTAELD